MQYKEIKLTQGKIAIVDKEDFEWLGEFKWSAFTAHGIYYAQTWNPKSLRLIRGVGRYTFMHRLILNCKKGEIVDHINHNGLDNRRSNLRIVTIQQNAMNSRPRKGGTSKYKGVCLSKRDNRWQAKIKFNKNTIWLGSYASEVDAAKAYNQAALKYFGEYACLNEIPEVGTQQKIDFGDY